MEWFKNIFNSNKRQKELIENKQLKELKKIKKNTKAELNAVKKEISEALEILNPKPVPIDFKLVDPLDNSVELFSFEKLLEPQQVQNKLKVKNDKSILSNLLGSIPELTSAGLLANSYRFIFPNGINGQVMRLGSGQGSAIMQNGSIVAHGTYVANALVAIPFAAYSLGSMIVQQHYLNKINNSLEDLNKKVERIIGLIFAEKKSKVEAIIYFYKKAFHEFDNINTNDNYRNAMLTNIIAKNIEVYELIQFYGSELQNTTIVKNKEDELKSFLELQDLFLYGKILAFMYSNLYDAELVDDLNLEITEMTNFYNKVLDSNHKSIEEIFKNNKKHWSDWWLGKESKKEKSKSDDFSELFRVIFIKVDINNRFNHGIEILENLISEIQKPQEYLIENRELFLIKDN